jgi:hypothetical protein
MGLITPLFNGEAIFGWPVTMHTEDPPRDKQVNAFVGINGVEVLDLGMRTRTTHVKGRYYADNEFILGQMFEYLSSYKNPFAYTLYTTKGQTFDFVQLQSIQEIPPVKVDASLGQVFQDFTVQLIHLR